MDKQRLTRLIIGCHVDRELLRMPPASKYDFFIQAGAALTDKRIYPNNDHDGFADSISDRNRRYSEMTAVYWAYRNVHTEYVGIEHYRRRFVISDEELDSLMDEGVGLITLKPLELGMPLYDFMNQDDFVSAFDRAMDILRAYHPEDFEAAVGIINAPFFRPCNMNIWKREYFEGYCEWLFPMLDEFHTTVPPKRDVYLHRDAGFMAERMSHVYAELLIKRGVSFRECDYIQYQSAEGKKDDADLSGEALLAELERLYSLGRIRQCTGRFFDAYRECETYEEELYNRYARVFELYMTELKYCERSLFEYLPEDMSATLKDAAAAVLSLGSNILSLLSDPGEAKEREFCGYIENTGFSGIAIGRFLSKLPSAHDLAQYVAAVLDSGSLSSQVKELMRYKENEL